MMKKQILLWCIVISLNASCISITQLFPKQPRPFQERKFDSAEWKKGDYQTRGEMTNRDSDASLIERLYKIEGNNSQEQIIELLGKPDQKTKAACCYAGRAGRSGEKDLWIYYIEVEKEAGKTTPKALKIYFDGNGVQPGIGDRDGNHDYFPAIG
jgi:hypothetical protein